MKVAVVGGGVSGLSSVWGLNEYSSHTVHLFEPGSWIGGHTNTQAFSTPNDETPVDTGFIVFNRVTYPNFLRFLQTIKVEILDSEMSFAVSRFAGGKRGTFEWSGTSPAALFCQATNLVNPGHWRMVWDIIRFNQQSVDHLRQMKGHKGEQISIGQWLRQRGYGQTFIRNYLIPMTASIWSTAPSTALESFPAITLLRFMHNHHLLQILDRPQWLTIKNGARSYVNKVLSNLPSEQIHRVEIVSASKEGEKWLLTDNHGNTYADFDRLIFSCHADTSVKILGDNLDDEVKQTLSKFEFSQNVAVLHSDAKLMPVRRQAWSAWNFMTETLQSGDADIVCLTYNMNILQHIPTDKFGHVLVTLNPATEEDSPYKPDPKTVQKTQEYEHPLYTPVSVQAQKELRPLQGRQGLFFAGAWTNYGFHEDGFSSGLCAAHQIGGVNLPFDIRDAERTLPAQKGWNVTTVKVLDGAAKAYPIRAAASLLLIIAVHATLILEFAVNILLKKVIRVDQKAYDSCAWKRTIQTIRGNLKGEPQSGYAKIKSM